jgi:hypothetical protein
MTLEKAVDMYTRRRIMQPQGDDFLLELSDDMKARVVARAWQEMGSPKKVNVRDLQAELVRRFEQPYTKWIEGSQGRDEVMAATEGQRDPQRLAAYILSRRVGGTLVDSGKPVEGTLVGGGS